MTGEEYQELAWGIDPRRWKREARKGNHLGNRDIASAPRDGSVITVSNGRIGIQLAYMYRAKFCDGVWKADFGKSAADRWQKVEPQPVRWFPWVVQEEPA